MPYVDSGGLRVYYTETGSGLPVLWHTGGCGDARMWQRAGYIEGLPGYRHILFDHRGHGRGQAVALNGLGHLQAFWRTDLALPPIKRFLATLGTAA